MPSLLESYGLATVTAPASEPITLAQAKAHCRVDTAITTDDDEFSNVWIPAARQEVEGYTGRALISQTLKMTLDAFPCDGEIRLPVAPVTSISAAKYIAADGTLTTISSSDYQLDETSSPARLWPSYDAGYWPTPRDVMKAVQIDFVVGYANAAAVPAILRAAVLMLIRAYYDGEASPGDITPAVKRVLDLSWTGLPHGAA